MYKPRTIGQFKVLEYLKSQFALDAFLVAPISRDGLMLTDRNEETIAFECCGNTIRQCDVPGPGTRSDMRVFIEYLNYKCPDPKDHTFETKTRLWLDIPVGLSHQQALGLTDDLYYHYLTHEIPDKEYILRHIVDGFVTPEVYRSIQLWYLDGHTMDTYLVIGGIDGIGTLIDLIFSYRTPNAEHHQFYLVEN